MGRQQTKRQRSIRRAAVNRVALALFSRRSLPPARSIALGARLLLGAGAVRAILPRKIEPAVPQRRARGKVLDPAASTGGHCQAVPPRTNKAIKHQPQQNEKKMHFQLRTIQASDTSNRPSDL